MQAIKRLKLSPTHAVAAVRESLIRVSTRPIGETHYMYNGTRRGFEKVIKSVTATTLCDTTKFILETLPDAIDIEKESVIMIEELGKPVLIIENLGGSYKAPAVTVINLTSFRKSATYTAMDLEMERVVSMKSSNSMMDGIILAAALLGAATVVWANMRG